jgi:mannitol/fructose-specific phosphotransferase system IIA component (Ntr-type)
MKSILKFQVNGIEQQLEFESPSDAIDTGVNQLLAREAVPISVSYQGKLIATKDDFSILWDEALRAKSSTISHE